MSIGYLDLDFTDSERLKVVSKSSQYDPTLIHAAAPYVGESVSKSINIDPQYLAANLSAFERGERIDVSSLTFSMDVEIDVDFAAAQRSRDELVAKASELLFRAVRQDAKMVCLNAVKLYRSWHAPAEDKGWTSISDNKTLADKWHYVPVKKGRTLQIFEAWERVNFAYRSLVVVTVDKSTDIDTYRSIAFVLSRPSEMLDPSLDELFLLERRAGKEHVTPTDALEAAKRQMKSIGEKYYFCFRPSIPKEAVGAFTYAGMLLPGYRVEGEELPRCFTGRESFCSGRECAACTDCPYKKGDKQ